MIFLSLTVFSEYANFFIKAIETVFMARVPEGPKFAAMSFYYSPFENVIVFLNPILVSMLALPPFLKEMRAKKEKSLLAITLVLGALLTLAVLFFAFNVVMGAAFQRIWGFAYIALAIWAGLFFWKKFGNARLRTVVSIAVIVVLFASLNVSSMETGIKKWYVPQEYMEAYMYSDSMVNTAQWCRDQLNGSILGDHFAYDMVGSWGYKEVDVWSFEEWYRTNDSRILSMFNYIILSPLDTVTYLDTFREPIDPFAMLPADMNVIYNSGDFVVYQNSTG
jgi:hypothetical protein